ncbi:hypothetical protein FVO59_13555 [Microbacterium esteraromaticum]|uniref:Uncharacterized protein n=1 Tax=Microbacterium esteraromaticum TaxID=57043 RepID=A0A7D8AL05_9MICO|nr:hypothetical protein [Microbacterium esteraromaticum]QMU98109.1 hypothetical protein FVO59_13555 [Microbacterium esteraromaticum]
MHAIIDTSPALLWETPALRSPAEHLERAGDHLWRVVDTRGSIRGHLRVIADPLGIRYRAERLHLASGAFRLVGEFWDVDDAVAALRG